MQNIKSTVGKFVRINAPEWFSDPEFQAWINSRLGEGLATWQHTDKPLAQGVLVPHESGLLASELLLSDAINADVFFEPHQSSTVVTLCRLDVGYLNELVRLKTARQTLDNAVMILKQLEAGGQVEIIACHAMAEKLVSDVINADILFDTENADSSEIERYNKAIKAFDFAYQQLMSVVVNGFDYEYGDIFVTVEPDAGEGSDSDMPEKFWNEVVRLAKEAGPSSQAIVAWISPI